RSGGRPRSVVIAVRSWCVGFRTVVRDNGHASGRVVRGPATRGDRRTQILATEVAGTIPVGVVQASGTKNDYVVAFRLTSLTAPALARQGQPRRALPLVAAWPGRPGVAVEHLTGEALDMPRDVATDLDLARQLRHRAAVRGGGPTREVRAGRFQPLQLA